MPWLPRRRGPALLVRTAACAGLALACTGPGAPAVDAPPDRAALRGRVVVRHAEPVGPYLDVSFERLGDGSLERFYFPAAPECRALLVPGGEARYRRVGSFGQLRGEDGAVCAPVGVATLGRWRDLESARRPARPPRVLAEYRRVADAGAWLLARGRFPLALEIRWPQPMDSVAVLPALPACRAALAAGRATLEFRADLERPFWLETGAGRCPIEGFALPPADERS
ncbi:MAG: hypothetical protein R3263_05750 [Myxococcota bacterium]|nr:hypothetical protein [Myxococcota bacterium]